MIASVSLSDPTVEKLRELYRSNPMAAALLGQLARRRRDTAELKIEHAMRILANEGVTAERRDVYQIFKAFEAFGFGQVIVGRVTSKTRIAWTYSPKAIGRAAAGTQEDIPELPEGATEETSSEACDVAICGPQRFAEPVGTDEVEFVPHELQLRPELTIQIELPLDISPCEASRIALFVRSLPFDGVPSNLRQAC